MPTSRVLMRKIRQTLQLLLEAKLTQRQVSSALGIPKSTVSDLARYARAAAIDWPTAGTLSDDELEARLYRPAVAPASRHLEPDYARIHQELKRPGVTLQLLWEEYTQQHAGAAYKYTSFCVKYAAWAKTLKRSMRQVHIAGERAFLDFAGHTMPVIDRASGEITQAQIFVAVLGASNYTYASATATQTAEHWASCTIDALEFFGGTPRLLVPDQPRAVAILPDRYEPRLHRLMQELCNHYSTSVLPARPAHPRDKPKVEGAVLLVERWILARLRNRVFFSLGELNRAMAQLLTDLNGRAFKRLPGSRRTAFELLDQPVLQALPAERMPIVTFKSARANIDYHVDYKGHFYSVPHHLVSTVLELRVSTTTLEAFHKNQRVAIHPLSTRIGGHTTTPEHMPASHREHLQWTPAKLIAWAERVGAATAAVVRWQMENRPHPEQGYRSCLGLMSLKRKYGAERLEAACARAQSIRAPFYRSISSILANGLDRQLSLLETGPAATARLPEHDNVRGANYYH